MSYKTILVHADATQQPAPRIALAAQLALACDAHLVGVATTGVSRYVYQEGGADLARTLLAPYMDGLFATAERALDRFERIASAAGVGSREKRLMDDEAGAALVLAARYADLVVLGQQDPAAPGAPVGGDLAAWVLLACARPLLVVPYAQQASAAGRRILVGWNGSPQAVRALAAALPFLRRAEHVTVASFDTPAESAADSAGLAPYLARHGVDADLVHDSTGLDVGEGLLSMAADRGADMLVMGGYGHARLRELLLGGATRTVMRSMTVPVLLAH
ncbi:MAG: universal stress protein [Telluria sp.]